MRYKIIVSYVIFLTLFSCQKEEENLICGVEDPLTQLSWLVDIVDISKIDSKGNYYGTIYLEYYKGNPVFYTDMAMGSGGVIGYWFNCDGSIFTIDDSDDFMEFVNNMKLDNIVFTNTDL